MLYGGANEFGLVISSQAGVRPADTYGTTVTPGNNTYGSYVQLISGANVTDDVYGILININSNNVAAANRDTILTIGVDAAGGTSYTDTLTHLLCSCAGNFQSASPSGAWYWFPYFIKAGSSIGAKASINNATVGTLAAWCKLFCKPTGPFRAGTYFRTFGEVTATSRGTFVTPGGASEGAWTQLGSAIAAGEDLWWWQLGMGVDDAIMGAVCYHNDLGIGDASNKKIAVESAGWRSTTAEILNNEFAPGYCRGVAGDLVYGRSQCSGTADTNTSLIAYAVGGGVWGGI